MPRLESAARRSTSFATLLLGVIFVLVAVLSLAKSHKLGQQVGPDLLQSGSPWPKFHGNNQNTGLSPVAGAGGALKWTFTPVSNLGSDYFSSSPVIGADGTIYAGDFRGQFFAIDGNTGSQKWKFTAGGTFETNAVIGSDGTVMVTCDDGHLYGLNGATGAEKWSFAIANPTIPSLGVAGVYMGSTDGNIYAVSPFSGQLNWKLSETSSFSDGNFSPLVIDSSDEIMVGSVKGDYYSIASNGKENWFINIGAVDGGTAIGGNGLAYIPGISLLFAFNISGENLLWTFAGDSGFERTPAIGPDGTVYVQSTSGTLYALNGSNGSQVWSASLEAAPCTPSVGADGTVYMGDAIGIVYALNGSTGNTVWTFRTSQQMSGSPAIGADGTLYVAADKMYAIGQAPISNFYASQTSLEGGNSTVGVVQIAAKSSLCSAVVSLSGGDSSISYPPTVSLPGNKTGVSFPIRSSGVTSNKNETLTASFAQSSKSITITLTPVTLARFYATPATFVGGSSSHGVVQLAAPALVGGTSVALSSQSSAVSVPAQVVVPAGSTGASFTVGSTARNSSISLNLTAQLGSSTLTTSVTIVPLTFYISPSSFTGGTSSHGVIQVPGANSGGQNFSLHSSSSSVIVPASVSIPAGKTGVSFSISSSAVSSESTITLTASSGAEVSTTTVTLQPSPIVNFYTSPSSITGGNVTFGVVQLSGKAGPSGDVVTLSSGDPHVTVPATVTVPAGSTGVSFQLRSTSVSAETIVELSASLGDSTAQASVTLEP